MKKSTGGFTIVELLIVIVVVAILAAVSIVAYRGIQQQAKLSTAKADLRNIMTQMEVYKVTNGSYPVATQGRPGGFPDIAQVLRSAGLYADTRLGADESTPSKSYLFCGMPTDTYAVVAVEPVLSPTTGEEASGQALHFVKPGGLGEATYVWDASIGGNAPTGFNICKSVDSSYDTTLGNVWSHNAPIPGAQ